MWPLREFNSSRPHHQYETSISILYKPNPQNQTKTLIQKRYKKEREYSPNLNIFLEISLKTNVHYMASTCREHCTQFIITYNLNNVDKSLGTCLD